MTLAPPTEATFVPRSGWRDWLASLRKAWRGSLSLRTLTLTLALTSTAILIILVGMALFVQNDLFDSRKQQVLDESRRAVAYAQTRLASAVVDGEGGALQELMLSAIDDIARISSSERIALFRIGAEEVPFAQVDVSTGGLTAAMLTEELRARVVTVPETQWWQSLSLRDSVSGMPVPGIVVGQQISVPEVGSYELYIAYDLAEPEQTLVFVQRTLWFAGALLVSIIGAIAWIVFRRFSSPIVEAADTSARLAAGDLGVRMPVQGEDEMAVLGRSFNAMADSIESQIKELGELSLVQQRFVSDVSHELRTPLTTIRLAADMINDQRENFDSITSRTAELLQTQVERFDQLLDDLLEISRYDAGSVQLEMEVTSLAQVTSDVIEQMMPLAASHGCELRLVAPGGYSLVELDPRRVRRILRNLIGNAIEHGQGRPVVVTVDSNERAVAVGVRDYGQGMQPEETGRVFDRFWRADPSRQRTIGGTGLGLSISLGDTHLHGGDLQVWSKPGAGSNFVLTLPRTPEGLDGSYPVPILPEDSRAELGGLTQPIPLAQLIRDLEGEEK